MSTTAFVYKARNADGKTYTGLETAESRKAVWNTLASRGLLPIKVEPLNKRDAWLDSIIIGLSEWPSAMKRARTGFWRIVRQNARRGRGPVEAMTAFLPECEQLSQRFTGALRDMLLHMTTEGKTFADVLRAHPKEFPLNQAALIEATEGKDTRIIVLDAIIEQETAERQSGAAAFAERMDAYVTDIVAVITLGFLSKWFVPNFAKVTTAALGHQQQLSGMVSAIDAAGKLTTSWTTYFLIGAFIMLGRAAYDHLKSNEEIACWIEEQRWKIPNLRQYDLTFNRRQALELIASLRHASTPEPTIFEAIIKSCTSPNFRKELVKQGDSVPALYKFEDSFGHNPLWGGEISSLLAASKGGTWVGDAKEIVLDLKADEASQRRINSLTVTYIHYAVSFIVVAFIVAGLFLLQLSFTLSLARS
jgi:type II secretory pathway component PulF